LSLHDWIWPTETYLQRRLRIIRAQQEADSSENQATGDNVGIASRAEPAGAATDRQVSVSFSPVVNGGNRRESLKQAPERPLASELPQDSGVVDYGELIPIDLGIPRKQPSPTRSLPDLGESGWMRAFNESPPQPVDISKAGLDAAVHKENMEKFRARLIHSDEWVPTHAGEQVAQAEPDVKMKPARQPTRDLKMEPLLDAPSAPFSSALPAELGADSKSSHRGKIVPPGCAAQASQSKDEDCWQSSQLQADVPNPKASEWDIDEKLLWLAKPSA
jgi:hypothetical protein